MTIRSRALRRTIEAPERRLPPASYNTGFGSVRAGGGLPLTVCVTVHGGTYAQSFIKNNWLSEEFSLFACDLDWLKT